MQSFTVTNTTELPSSPPERRRRRYRPHGTPRPVKPMIFEEEEGTLEDPITIDDSEPEIVEEEQEEKEDEVEVTPFRELFLKLYRSDRVNRPKYYCRVCLQLDHQENLVKCSHSFSCNRFYHFECFRKNIDELHDCKECHQARYRERCCGGHYCHSSGCENKNIHMCTFCSTSFCRDHTDFNVNSGLAMRHGIFMCSECNSAHGWKK